MKWTHKRNKLGDTRTVRRFAWHPVCLNESESESVWLWFGVFYERQRWQIRNGCDAITGWVAVGRWL